MKNIKYFILILFTFFISNICVYASCTNGEILELKNKSKNIKVTYKHLGLIEELDGSVYYNSFDVTIKNIDTDFYLSIFEGENGILKNTDGTIKLTLDTGNYSLKVYSNKCNTLIHNINFRLPRFNVYSLDTLCEGVDAEDFRLCGKYYESYVQYNEFVTRVKQYRDTHDVKKEDLTNENEVNIFDNIIDFIIKYKVFFIIGVVSILLILFIVLIIRKNKKRGVLE